MRRPFIRRSSPVLFALLLVATVMAGAGQAQSRSVCQSPVRPSLGVAIGRSSPYVELTSGAVPIDGSGSVRVEGGLIVTARGDLSIAGPLRVRVEGSTARWGVSVQTYDPANNYQVIADTPAGQMTVRQIGASVGLRGGRALCAHVLVGGGFYSLDYRGASINGPAFSITAGVEFPTGERGAVQVDVQLNMIQTRGRYPVASSTVLAAALVAGWAYRF